MEDNFDLIQIKSFSLEGIIFFLLHKAKQFELRYNLWMDFQFAAKALSSFKHIIQHSKEQN
jgi:hypothetical protein